MKPKKFELDNDTTEEDDEQAVLPVKEETPSPQRKLPFNVLKRIRRGKPKVD